MRDLVFLTGGRRAGSGTFETVGAAEEGYAGDGNADFRFTHDTGPLSQNSPFLPIKHGARAHACSTCHPCLVPTGRLELPQLSPPPPQDGVSTNSTTSASGSGGLS